MQYRAKDNFFEVKKDDIRKGTIVEITKDENGKEVSSKPIVSTDIKVPVVIPLGKRLYNRKPETAGEIKLLIEHLKADHATDKQKAMLTIIEQLGDKISRQLETFCNLIGSLADNEFSETNE